jgi:large subunit ribosomal protein L31
MKSAIHPVWYNDAVVTCSCGNTFTTGSTKPEIKVDICSACHPFFTGEMRFVDVQGRVEKFQAKQKNAAAYKAKTKSKKQAGSKPAVTKSLKDMLTDLKIQPTAAGKS